MRAVSSVSASTGSPYGATRRVPGMSDTHPVGFGSGPPATELPAPDPVVVDRLARALAMAPAERRDEVAAVVADHPRSLDAWAALGDTRRDTLERYAAYRVGYHRGLDALRANGWRGSGYVRWAAPSNRGFLRCLLGLGAGCAQTLPGLPVVSGPEDVGVKVVFLVEIYRDVGDADAVP